MATRRIASAIVALGLCAFQTPDAAFAASTPDPLLSLAATPENLAKGLEIDGYQLGVSAYVWGYALVRMEGVARDYTDVPANKPATSYRAPLNQIGWATELATSAAKDMPTANNDTLYMSAVVDLTEPYVLSVPDTNDRYYVVNVFNMWQELEHYIGRRTTGTKAGQYVLVPPGWEHDLPAGLTRLDVTTSKVWLWGRLRISAGEDPTPVHALQAQFDLRPLSAIGEADYRVPSATLPRLPDVTGDELGFLNQLAAALQSNPVRPADTALFAQFARIGLTERGFDPSKLTPPMKSGLARGLADGPYAVLSALATSASRRNGWDWVTGLDSFGFNYALRSLVAGPYLGGNGEKEAMYPIRYTDADGQALTGDSRYTLRFDREPPVDGFWSVTMYDAGDKMLVPNDIGRYKIGTDTQGLVRGADGSLTLAISAAKPAGPEAANWLPAPKGPFYLILRLYQPSVEILKGQYELPQVVRTKP
ncbi:DUF1254 domain-containing protein [Kaistia algarum]|uniref:DUF1254 domain-containing protein n=1 Tax=Kaistia algarum TaxID=2083279 RepID=UPI000CE90449|nr:DUF1254 domain-containing protein [Kaistia algarum]MCX5516505.1 DUF1214 domain-containing protein [Kaistia algarum]PPE78380.1 DUF1254 domain-containing protein [Kaistia algarum]